MTSWKLTVGKRHAPEGAGRRETGTLGVLLLLFEEGRSIHYARGAIELQSPRLPRVKAAAGRFRIDSSARRLALRLRPPEAE